MLFLHMYYHNKAKGVLLWNAVAISEGIYIAAKKKVLLYIDMALISSTHQMRKYGTW